VGDEKFTIFDQAGFIGSLVNSVKSRTFFVVEVSRNRFVREKHELLDQLVGFVGGLFFNPVRSALGIEENAQFGEIQVEGALGEALPTKSRGEVPGAVKEAVEIVLGGTTEAEKGFGVCEAVAGVDDRAGEAGGAGFAFGIEANEGGVGEALFIGAEGAETVRKTGREHGDDAVDEVNAIGAFAGLVIQFGSGFDVVGDVGDVDTDLHVAVGKFAEGDGVVEIASGIGVDRDDEVAAQILPSDRAIGKFDWGKRFGLGEGFGREGGGEIKFPDDGENVDAWIGGAAEAFDEEAFWVGSAIFPVDQFGDDFVAGFGLRGAVCARGWDVEIVEKAGVVRDDDEEAGGFLESADDHGGAAFEDAVDAAAGAVRFGRTAAAGGGSGSAIDAGYDEVAVEGGACVLCGDVKVGGSVGRNHEGKAFRVKLDGSGDEVCIACGDVVSMSDAGDAPLFF
jgi:hypothetical protein